MDQAHKEGRVVERREFITGALAALGLGSLLPPRLWEFKVEVWLVSEFSLDQVPLRLTLRAACSDDVWQALDRWFPHHAPGEPEMFNSAWKRSVQGDWDAPWKVEA